MWSLAASVDPYRYKAVRYSSHHGQIKDERRRLRTLERKPLHKPHDKPRQVRVCPVLVSFMCCKTSWL